jgi:transcriptional regulator GlxA family with amidase domain
MRGTPAKHRVIAVVLDGFAPLDLAAVASVFSGCSPHGDAFYSFLACGQQLGRLKGLHGFEIEIGRGIDALGAADTIIVTGFADIGLATNRRLEQALSEACERGARLIGIASGVFVLARAGVLDGRRAAVDPESASNLAERHPSIHVDTDTLVVDDRGVLTCAGPLAGIELCFQVVRSDLGVSAANELAHRLLGPHRISGQAQFVPCSPALGEPDAIERTLDWMSTNLHRPLANAALAARAHMSLRHFTRRFADQTGTTPMQWLLTRRVLAARELLERSDLSAKRIAARTGFPSARSLRTQFKSRMGMSPLDYRADFKKRRAP